MVFDAILRHGSVNGAARRLHLSQPAVSGALARLRHILQDQLFIRTRRGMVPTQRALELGPVVATALSSLRDALSSGQDFEPSTSTRTFTVLMSEIGQILFLPVLTEQIRKIAPGIRLVVTTTQASRHMEAFENGEIDIAVGVWPHLKEGMIQRRLFIDGWMCVAREDHPQIGETLTLSEYLALDHVTVSSVSGGDGIIAKTLRGQGLDRRIALQVTDFLASPLIVAKTDLIATAPEELARFYASAARLRTVELLFDLPKIDLRLYWHKRSETDRGAVWLREMVLTLLLKQDDGQRSFFRVV
ncbi:LysR family transcriptional regulator [Amorphus sp. 3PC139-8]